MTYRKRDYCFTINNWTPADEENLKTLSESPKVRYLVIGREVGEEGTPHLQCYIYFHNATTFDSVKKQLPRAHIEAARGTSDQAIEYCKKDGDFHESGEAPISQKRKGEMGKEYWDDVVKKAKAGDLEQIDSCVFVRHYRTLRLIEKDYMSSVPDLEDTCGYWFYGPSGTGKSRSAREKFPNPYLKMCNKWWDGYQKQEFVVIEDFDKAHIHLGHHLKLWADRYAFLAESKGSAHQIRPLAIVVTSNYHPSDIWGNEPMTLNPILRCFVLTHFVEKLNVA